MNEKRHSVQTDHTYMAFHMAFCAKLPSFPISMPSIGNFNTFVLMALYYIIIKRWCRVHLKELMYQRHPILEINEISSNFFSVFTGGIILEGKSEL